MTDDLSPAISFASRLRQAGIRTQLYTEQKKFKQKMSYADKLGVPYVVFLGEDEVRQGAVSVKDMISGEQNTLPLDQAVVHMKNDLAVRLPCCLSGSRIGTDRFPKPARATCRPSCSTGGPMS